MSSDNDPMEEEVELDMPDITDPIYDNFDDLSIGVMQRNLAALHDQRKISKQRMQDSKDLTFRFNVTTPLNYQDREKHGVVNKIDLREAAKVALRQMHGYDNKKKVKLPSQTCYLKEIALEDATNNLPVDVHLKCVHGERDFGNYCSSEVTGSKVIAPKSSLYCVHAGSNIHSDSGRVLHSVSGLVNQDKFTDYVQALERDVKKSTSVIKGGKAIEYLSPHVVLTDDAVTQGDWLVNVMFKNPQVFKHPVVAMRTPRESEVSLLKNETEFDNSNDTPTIMSCSNVNEDEDTFKDKNLTEDNNKVDDKEEQDTYVCSFRCHKEDWDRLTDAVSTNIVQPLKSAVIDLSKTPYLHMSLVPVVNFCDEDVENAGNDSAVVRSGALAWKQDEVSDHPGRCTVSCRATIKFI